MLLASMKSLNIGLTAAAIAWVAGIASFAFWQFGPSVDYRGMQTRAAGVSEHGDARSIGFGRQRELAEMSKRLAESGAVTSVDVAEGRELAPVADLNAELERTGASWRVRKVDGLVAETFDIS